MRVQIMAAVISLVVGTAAHVGCERPAVVNAGAAGEADPKAVAPAAQAEDDTFAPLTDAERDALRLTPEQRQRLEKLRDETMIDLARHRLAAAGWKEMADALPKGISAADAAKVIDRAMSDPRNAASYAREMAELLDWIDPGMDPEAARAAELAGERVQQPQFGGAWLKHAPSRTERAALRRYFDRLAGLGFFELMNKAAAAPYAVNLTPWRDGAWDTETSWVDVLPSPTRRLLVVGTMQAAHDDDNDGLAPWLRRWPILERLDAMGGPALSSEILGITRYLMSQTTMQALTDGLLRGAPAEAALAALNAPAPVPPDALAMAEAWRIRAECVMDRLLLDTPPPDRTWPRVWAAARWRMAVRLAKLKPPLWSPEMPEPAWLKPAAAVATDLPDWPELSHARTQAEVNTSAAVTAQVGPGSGAMPVAARVVWLLEQHRARHGDYPPSVGELDADLRAALPRHPDAPAAQPVAESWKYARLPAPDADGRRYTLQGPLGNLRPLNPAPLRPAPAETAKPRPAGG